MVVPGIVKRMESELRLRNVLCEEHQVAGYNTVRKKLKIRSEIHQSQNGPTDMGMYPQHLRQHAVCEDLVTFRR